MNQSRLGRIGSNSSESEPDLADFCANRATFAIQPVGLVKRSLFESAIKFLYFCVAVVCVSLSVMSKNSWKFIRKHMLLLARNHLCVRE